MFRNFLIALLAIPVIALPQAVTIKKDSVKNKTPAFTPEIFTSGFIDIVSNGQVNASARFIRLMIGEPGRFAIPLSLYGGVSNSSFQTSSNNTSSPVLKSNNHLVNQYINPLSGLINISVDNIIYFKQTEALTKYGWLYHIGGRVLTGVTIGPVTNPTTGRQVNFLNSFGASGIYFQTGAWDRNNARNLGVFWLAGRLHICYSSPGQIQNFLPGIQTNGIYTGCSIGFGIEINNLVNIKAIYYKYFKEPEIDYGYPIYQFSFNYTFKK